MNTPKLPSERELTRQLRALHEAWSHPAAGGEYAHLLLHYRSHARCCQSAVDLVWEVVCVSQEYDTLRGPFGHEYVPGSREVACASCICTPTACPVCGNTGRVHVPTPFDAVAAARRLLAAARDGLVRK